MAALAAIAGLAGCSPLADMQTGRVLDRGQQEVTPFVTSMGVVSGAGADDVQSSYGVLAGIGVLDRRRLDFRFRYERILREYGDSVDVFGFGPKVRLGSDVTAFYLPVGFGVADDWEESPIWEIQPTFLATDDWGSWVEVTSSAKAVFRLVDESKPAFGMNIGMGIGPNPRRVSVRPEMGILFGPAGGPTYHLSIGLSVGIGKFPEIVPRENVVDGFALGNLVFETSFREVRVTGEIVNRTGEDLPRARFVLLCMDPLGTVLAETHFEIERLDADERRPFDLVVTGSELDRVSRCVVRPAD
jgi:hypothetical protein